MNLTCQRTRDHLLDGDIDATVSEHLRTCDACRAFASELASMDAELTSLAQLDAPDFLVGQTLARIQADAGLHLVQSGQAPSSQVSASQPREVIRDAHATSESAAPLGLGSLLLAAFWMLVSAVGALIFLPLTLLEWLRASASAPRRVHALPPSEPVESASLTKPMYAFEEAPRRTMRWAVPFIAASSVCTLGLLWLTLGETVNSRVSPADARLGTMGFDDDHEAFVEQRASAPMAVASPATQEPEELANGTDPMSALGALMGGEIDNAGGFGGLGLRGTGRGGAGTGDGDGALGVGNFRANLENEAEGAALHRGRAQIAAADPADDTSTTRLRLPVRNPAPSGPEAPVQNTEGRDQPVIDERLGGQHQGLFYRGEGDHATDGAFEGADRAVPVWQDAQRTTGLTFAAHDGWWENTYIPGDSEVRMLQARVAAAGGTYLSLVEHSAPTVPAVAAPTERAVAVGVHADRAAIEGPTRVRVEVALRGIQLAAGRRGALRIALVVDTEHPLNAEAQGRVRSLVSSLARSVGSRDRVMLVGAGQHGGTLVPLGAMRAGAMEVALRHLLVSGDRNTSPTTLASAVDTAIQGVMSDDGAGLVLLLSADGSHDHTLDASLRRGALAGVVTSAVGLSPNTDFTHLDGIALLGQGRRSLVLSDARA